MGGSPKRSLVDRDMQVAVGHCLPMCLCVWRHNFSMERDKDLDQGSSDHGWLRWVLVRGHRNPAANEAQQSRATELKVEEEALELNMAIF